MELKHSYDKRVFEHMTKYYKCDPKCSWACIQGKRECWRTSDCHCNNPIKINGKNAWAVMEENAFMPMTTLPMRKYEEMKEKALTEFPDLAEYDKEEYDAGT